MLSCGTVDPPEIPPTQGKDYYPLQEMQRLYQVDTITFDLNGNMRVQDTSFGYLRHRLQMIDSNWVIELAYRADSTLDWQIQEYISIIEQDAAIIENFGGAPLQKIKWPIKEGSSWEETAFVPADYTIVISGEPVKPFSAPWNVNVSSFDEPFQLNELTFDETLTKQMVDEDLLIEYRKVSEVYARNIGLIYQHARILDTQCEHRNNNIENCLDDKWVDKANRGYITEMKLISWQ